MFDDPLIEARLVPDPPRADPPRIARPVRIDPLGLDGPTRHQARGMRWRRVARGWVAPADIPVDPTAQRIIDAAVTLLPGEAVTGWASLHLARTRYVEGTTLRQRVLPVRLVVRSVRRGQAGVTSHRAALDPCEIVMRGGVPCTNIHRALLDELCALDAEDAVDPGERLREAVVLLDMVLHAELTSLARFWTYLATVGRRRGLRLARAALSQAVEGSESPRETLMRMVWVLDAGLPPPLCNRAICSPGGRFLARPDLLSPECGVVGEYDGLHHKQTRRRSKDISREGSLRNAGLEYFSFVAGELNDRVGAVKRMHDAVRRAGQLAQPQTWRLVPASWCLDERLRLRELSVELCRGAAALEALRRDTPCAARR